MKLTIKHLALVAFAAASMTACNNGGSGGGSSQPDESPVARYTREQNLNLNNNPTNDRNVWNRQYNRQTFGTANIANGRIMNRQLVLVSGWVLEQGNDTCYPSNKGNYTRVNPITPGSSEILLHFDGSGNMNMKMSNFVGEHRTTAPLQYQLDPSSPVVVVEGPASATTQQQAPGVLLHGFPSPNYFQMQTEAGYKKAKSDFFREGRQMGYRGNLEKAWAQKDLGLGLGSNGFSASGGWGFDPNSPMDTLGGINQNQQNIPPFQAQGQQQQQQGLVPQQAGGNRNFLPGVQTGGEISILFPQGFKMAVQTAAPTSPRYIMRVVLWDVAYAYTRQVKTEHNTCVDRGTGRIKAYLQ